MTYIPLLWAVIPLLFCFFLIVALMALLRMRKAQHRYDNQINTEDIRALARALNDAIEARNNAREKWLKCHRELQDLKAAQYSKAA